MQMIDIQNPSERKKLIGAGVLGMLALVLLWWTFVGFGTSGSKVSSTAENGSKAPLSRSTLSKAQPQTPVELKGDLLDQLRPVDYVYSLPNVPEAKRNIFVYYEPPPPPPVKPSVTPTPTPTPTPPVLLASLSPSNVFARTSDFTLEVSGDKFTPQLKVLIDNNEMATRYISPQQLSATVLAVVIANPGGRQVMLRSADGALYSNSVALSVAAPPIPNFTYVGIIGTHRHIDTAILQDKASKEILNVQRGDLLGGRFRVTSISEKELIVVDSNLKIKHTLAYSTQGERGNALQRPTPRVEGEDDEL
jgi:hypothetical protein